MRPETRDFFRDRVVIANLIGLVVNLAAVIWILWQWVR